MQLSTVINRLNRSNPEPIYIRPFIPYLSGDEYEYEGYDEDLKKICYHYVRTRYCTDTVVGVKVFFFNGEAFGLSNQVARKSEEEFYILEGKEDVFKEVITFIETFRKADNYYIPFTIKLNIDIPSFYTLEFEGYLTNFHYENGAYFGDRKVSIIRKRYSDILNRKVTIKDQDQVKEVDISSLKFRINIS